MIAVSPRNLTKASSKPFVMIDTNGLARTIVQDAKHEELMITTASRFAHRQLFSLIQCFAWGQP